MRRRAELRRTGGSPGREPVAPSWRVGTGPSRTEVAAAFTTALAILVAGVVVSIVVAGAIPKPSFSTDRSVAARLLVQPSILPGWRQFGHTVLNPSRLGGQAGLIPSAQVLRNDHACALLDGPTSPHLVTAVATTSFSAQGTGSHTELAAESVVYGSAGPVEADEAMIRRPGLGACIGRLLSRALPPGAGSSVTNLAVEPPIPGLGNVEETAVVGTWDIAARAAGKAVGQTRIRLEVVFVIGSRAEVELVFDRVGRPIPPALVKRTTTASAQELEALLG